MHLRALVLALLLPCVSAPGIALAQAAQTISDADKAAARQLTIDGYASLERRDYADAEAKFGRAYALYRAPTVTLGLARAKVGLGHLVAAQELYNRLVHEQLPPDASAAFVKAAADGRAELVALEPRIPALVIQVKGTDTPKVTVDGAEVPVATLGIKRPVDPGRHVVRVLARRFVPKELTVAVAEGGVGTVTIDLVPAPPGMPDGLDEPGTDAGSRGSGQKIAGFAALGVGAAGLVVGAVTTGLAAAKHSSLLAQCPTGLCPLSLQPKVQPDIDTYRTLGGVAVGGWVAGGALAVGGVILTLTAPRAKTDAAAVSPVVGPGFVGVSGRM
jgi:hypothetical protein